MYYGESEKLTVKLIHIFAGKNSSCIYLNLQLAFLVHTNSMQTQLRCSSVEDNTVRKVSAPVILFQ